MGSTDTKKGIPTSEHEEEEAYNRDLIHQQIIIVDVDGLSRVKSHVWGSPYSNRMSLANLHNSHFAMIGNDPLREMLSFVSNLGDYTKHVNKGLAMSETLHVSKETERGIIGLLVKDFIKTSGLVAAAYKTYEDSLDYSIILKNDNVENRCVFIEFEDDMRESFQDVGRLTIHFISSKLEKHIIHVEKIV